MEPVILSNVRVRWSSGQHSALRALPRGPSPGEELAKQEVPEGDSREEVQGVNGNRVSTRKVSAFIR